MSVIELLSTDGRVFNWDSIGDGGACFFTRSFDCWACEGEPLIWFQVMVLFRSNFASYMSPWSSRCLLWTVRCSLSGLRLILETIILLPRTKKGWVQPFFSGPSNILVKCHMFNCLAKLRYLVWEKKMGSNWTSFSGLWTLKPVPPLIHDMM